MPQRLLRVLAVAWFFLLSAFAFAQSGPPLGDVLTYSTTPTQNYGSYTSLFVQKNTVTSRSYIKFNLGTLPTGVNVSKATLRLFVNQVAAPGSFDAYQLNTSWSESALTYNNAPALGTSATGNHPVAFTASSLNQFIVIDITPLVQGWMNGSIANNGLALAVTSTSGSVSFDSKEGIYTSHEPELEVALTGPAGPAGPQGSQGPQGQTGAMGPAGPQGTRGQTGATGPVGPQGPIGLTGPQGATGAQGTQGLTGATGPIGPQGPQGQTGASGPIGPQGPIGLTGAQGPAGTNGTNGTGFNYRGLFDPSTNYSQYDVVTYNGSTYDATTTIASGGGNPDSNPAWSLMAQAGAAGPAGATGPQGPIGNTGPQGQQGNTGAQGPQGNIGPQGPIGLTGPQGPIGNTGPQGPQGETGDANARMIFPSFFPGNLSGTWVGGKFVLDQAITVLRMAITAKTPTDPSCVPAVFRFTDGSKGQDLVLTTGQNWSDTGAIVLTFAAGATLQASLRTGVPTCSSTLGADANMLVEYKMQAQGDTDSCLGTPCGGICTLLTGDPGNCGTCGVACPSNQTCTGGACTPVGGGGCPSGQVLCGGQCVNTQTDLNNCGACGDVCPQGQNSSPVCSGGVCSLICQAGFGDCDHNPNDGCEVNLQNNNNNCGACGVACQSGQTCVAGACQSGGGSGNGQACNTGSQCSSGNCSQGVCCNANCSGSCQSCALPGTVGTCTNDPSGSIGSPSCSPFVCNGSPSCPTTCTSNSNCANGYNCVGGTCTQTTCGSGQILCSGGICVNPQTDPNNCGGCGDVCPSGPQSFPLCTNGQCVLICQTGYGNCDGNPHNGCEVNLLTDRSNCGQCGNVCNILETCVSGTCQTQ